MDFHKLTRRDLQALCKKNKIPANITNIAMADALASLPHVEGLEELLNPDSSANPEIGSPNVATNVRRSSRRKPITNEPESAQTVTRTTRRSTRRGVTDEVPETPSAQTNIKRETMASTRKKLDTQLREERENDQSAVQRSTRRSVRLSEKKNVEQRKTQGLKMNPIKIEELCEDLSKDLKINELAEGIDVEIIPDEVYAKSDVEIISDEVSAKSEVVHFVLSNIAKNEMELEENVVQKIDNENGFGIDSDVVAVPDETPHETNSMECTEEVIDESDNLPSDKSKLNTDSSPEKMETPHETNSMQCTEEGIDESDNLPSDKSKLNTDSSSEKMVNLSVDVVPLTTANPTEVLELVDVQDISADGIINSVEANNDGVLKFSEESVANSIEVEVKSLDMEFQDNKEVTITIPVDVQDISAKEIINSREANDDGVEFSEESVADSIEVEVKCLETEFQNMEATIRVPGEEDHHGADGINSRDFEIVKEFVIGGCCDKNASEVQENINVHVDEANAEGHQTLISDEVVCEEKSDVILENAVNDSANVHAIVADLVLAEEMNSETPIEDPIDSADVVKDQPPNPEESATITQVSEVVEENSTVKSQNQLVKCSITMKLSDDVPGNMGDHISHVLMPKQLSSKKPTAVQTVQQVSDNKENVDNRGTVMVKSNKENPENLQKASLRQLRKMFKQKLQIADSTNMKEDENNVKVVKPRPALQTLTENIG